MNERKWPVCGSSDVTSFHPGMELLSQEHGRAEELCTSTETHMGLNPSSANQRIHKLGRVTSPVQDGKSNSYLTGDRGAFNKIHSVKGLAQIVAISIFSITQHFSITCPVLGPWLAPGKTATDDMQAIASQLNKEKPVGVRTAVDVPCGGRRAGWELPTGERPPRGMFFKQSLPQEG